MQYHAAVVNAAATVLMFVVLALIIASAVIVLLFTRRMKQGNFGNPFEVVVLPAVVRKQGFAALSDRLRNLFGYLSVPSTWFTQLRGFWIGRRMAQKGEELDLRVFMAGSNENPLLVHDGIANLTVCLVAWQLLEHNNWQSVISRTLLAVIGIGVLARHAGYLMSPSLPSKLRRASWNPYAHFVAVCGLDFAVVTVFVAFLQASDRFGSMLDTFWQTGEDIVTLHYPRQIWTSRTLDWHVLTGSVASLLVYATIVQSISKRSDFDRTPEDLRAMAASQNLQGHYLRALELTSEAGQKDGRYAVFERATALAGKGDFRAAWECSLAAAPLGSSTDQAAIGLAFSVSRTPVSFETRLELLKFLADQHVSDLACVVVLQTLINFSTNHPSSEQFVSLHRWAGSYNNHTSYSLARAQALWYCEDPRAARELAQAAITGSAGEELFRILILGALEFADSTTEWTDDVARLLSWRESYANGLLPLVDQIESDDELFVVGDQALGLESGARRAGYPHVEELTHLVSAVRSRCTDKVAFDRVRAARRAMDRMLGW